MFIRTIISLCLVSSIAAFGKKTRIVGGVDANIEEYPFLASLRRISDGNHVCGGAILNEHYILTAAHCFGEKHVTLPNLIIFLGSSSLLGYTGTSYLADKIFIHPAFAGIINGISYSNDIAVVKVKGAIKFTDFQKPINLPNKNVHHGDIGMLAGWGTTSFPSNVSSNKLQKVRMVLYENHRCRPLLKFDVHNDQFCGFRKLGIGACLGDSGSPFFLGNTVIGVTSISIPCATGIPDVYTNVYSHLDFITTVLER